MHTTELFHCAHNSTDALKYVCTETFSQTFTKSNLRTIINIAFVFKPKGLCLLQLALQQSTTEGRAMAQAVSPLGVLVDKVALGQVFL
jgi:hypothetical protein